MPKYEYKDTGIEWLGEIPKHWNFDRVKDVSRLRDEKISIHSEELNYLELEDIEQGTGKILNYRNTIEVASAVMKFKKGDVLFSKLRPYLEKYNYAEIDGLCTGEILAIEPKRIYGKFLNYFVGSPNFIKQCNVLAYGTKMPRVNWNKQISTFNIPLPPFHEQKAIAAYLDKACDRIDKIIAIKQKQLEKIEGYLGRKIDEIFLKGIKDFPKKDSRKDFIGQIPSHYKVHKLKHITKQITDGTHSTPNYLDRPTTDSVPFLRVTDVQTNNIELKNVKYIDLAEHIELIKRCKPEKGDLLLSKNGTIGITKIVNWDWDFSIFVSLALIKPDRQIDVEYLNYYFKSDIMAYQLHHGSKQITVTNLHLDKIREFYIVTPPIKEQKQIVEKIKFLEHKVNSTKKNIESQITTLRAYRKSLIHECVTGKKPVWEGEIEKVE